MDINNYVNDCINSIIELVKIKTVEDKPVENGPFGLGNKICLQKALDIASSLGFKTVNLDGYCGYAEIGSGKEIVGIIGHLDVVPEGINWDFPPYECHIENNVLYGRGVWDDKGPIVMALYALKALKDEGFIFNKRVRIIFGCNEESGSRCMEYYLKKEGQISYGFSPDADFPVIFAEKTINNIEFAGSSKNNGTIKLLSLDAGIVINAVPDTCKFKLTYECNKCKERAINHLAKYYEENNIKYEVEDNNDNTLSYVVHGIACHGSTPSFGKNAASFAISSLYNLVDNSFVNFYSKYINTDYNGKLLNCYAEDEYGPLAFNVGIVSYKDDNFKVLVNSRLPFNLTSDKMVLSIKETLKNEDVKVTLLSNSNGFKMDKDSKLITSLVKAFNDEIKDDSVSPICTPGGTYAREFNNCVAFGPEYKGFGDITIHMPNEKMDLKVVPTIIKIYYNAIKNIVTNVSYEK